MSGEIANKRILLERVQELVKTNQVKPIHITGTLDALRNVLADMQGVPVTLVLRDGDGPYYVASPP